MARSTRRKQKWQWQVAILFPIALALSLIFLRPQLQEPPGAVDAVLVLGGSIKREIYAAQWVRQHPDTPVLISAGSDDPCILLIFQRERSPIDKVWLEHCAQSTFENFYYTLPILQQWQARKVQLITSPTHLPRARWLAQIILGVHGIWVETHAVEETGVPGNREFGLKTALDVVRGIFWAGMSQFWTPKCMDVIPLLDVNLAQWQQHGFKCEYQGKIDPF
jgi:uncharacterized SAM-binding protein YcdF (DUF218 family)